MTRSTDGRGHAAARRTETLVTGANGYLARVVCARLSSSGRRWRGVVREPAAGSAVESNVVAIGDYAKADWRAVLDSVDCVVHLAALTERARGPRAPSTGDYLSANRDVTRQLSEAAVQAGVRRVILVSSIKVCGESTPPGAPLSVDAPLRPLGGYAESKAAGELALRTAVDGHGVEFVILRPTIVYGPGAGGNFASLADAIRRGWPLPLRGVLNRRSLLYSGNAAAAIEAAIDSRSLAGRAWPVADGEVVSTEALATTIGDALRRPARLFHVPAPLFRAGARALGRPGIATRLFDSLEVDAAPFWNATGIVPRAQRDAIVETLSDARNVDARREGR